MHDGPGKGLKDEGASGADDAAAAVAIERLLADAKREVDRRRAAKRAIRLAQPATGDAGAPTGRGAQQWNLAAFEPAWANAAIVIDDDADADAGGPVRRPAPDTRACGRTSCSDRRRRRRS